MLPAILSAVAGAAAFPVIAPIMERLISGSPEDQMRRQMQVQEEFEQRRAGGGAGGDPYAGLVGGYEQPNMASLLADERLMRELEGTAYKLKRAREATPRHLEELGDIIAGQDARISALQSQRTLTPLEVIQMMEAFGG